MDVLLFLIFAYFFSWTGAFAYFALGGSVSAPSYPFAAAIYMIWPAVAACMVQGGFGRRHLTELGLIFRFNRWLLLAWVLAPLMALATVGIGLALPGTGWTLTPGDPSNPLVTAMPPGQAVRLGNLGFTSAPALVSVVLIAGMLAGATVNLVVGMGQELGWRGLLYRNIRHFGFWRMSWVTGLAWGFWYLPLLLHGHLYPGNSARAVLTMILLTLLFSPILFFVREKSGTVLAPAVLHGTFNALGGLSLFVEGGGAFWTGTAAVAGLAVMAAVNLGIFWWQRRYERVIAL